MYLHSSDIKVDNETYTPNSNATNLTIDCVLKHFTILQFMSPVVQVVNMAEDTLYSYPTAYNIHLLALGIEHSLQMHHLL